MISGSSWWPRPCAGASPEKINKITRVRPCGFLPTASRTVRIWRTPWITDIIWTATSLRRAKGDGLPPTRGSPLRPGAEGERPCGVPRHPPGLQADGGHLRRRVRRPRPLATTHLMTRERGPPGVSRADDGAGNGRCWCWLRPHPHRSGHRSSTTVRVHSVWALASRAMRPSSSTTTPGDRVHRLRCGG